MLPYIIIIAIVSFFSFFDIVKFNRRIKNGLIWLLLIGLILFVGTRYETGNDWIEYTKVFNKLPDVLTLLSQPALFGLFRMEPGYILFNSIVKYLGGTIDYVFLISTVFTIALLFKSLKRYNFFCFLAVLLYMRYGYLQTNMMFVRQGIAISIFFYSLKYIQYRKLVKYILLILVATSFHSSALITLPLYFFINKTYSNTIIGVSIIISFVLSFMDISKLLIPVLPGFISNHIISYSEDEIWGEMTGRFNFGLFEKLIIGLLCLCYRKKLNSIHNFNLFFNLFILSIICYYSFFQMYVFQQRLSMLLQIAAIPVIISLVKLLKKSQQIYSIAFLSIFIIYFFLNYIHKSFDIYIPYKSWLF